MVAERKLPDLVKSSTEQLISECAPRTVILIGSMARGDWKINSDIDLILVGPKYDNVTELREKLTQQKHPVSITTCSQQDLINLWTDGDLAGCFIAQEGILVFDDGFYKENIPQSIKPKVSFKYELKKEFKKAQIFRQTSRFAGNYTYVFNRLYGVFKNIAIYKLAQDGVIEPRKDVALRKLFESYPKINHVEDYVTSLYDYHLLVTRNIKIFPKISFDDTCVLVDLLDVLEKIKRDLL